MYKEYMNTPPPPQGTEPEGCQDASLPMAFLRPLSRTSPSSHKGKSRDFPSGPVVKTYLPMQGARVRSLVGKLRSHRHQHPKTKT